MITNIEALPALWDLLYIASEDNYADMKGSFFRSKIVEAIFSIGRQSETNFNVVKTDVELFITQHSSSSSDFSYLRANVMRMEDHILKDMINTVTFKEAHNNFVRLFEKTTID
jgi:hypothetical protein